MTVLIGETKGFFLYSMYLKKPANIAHMPTIMDAVPIKSDKIPTGSSILDAISPNP